MSHTVMHVTHPDKEFVVKSKNLIGEYTSFAREALAYRLMEECSIEFNIDFESMIVLNCRRNGTVIERFYGGGD